MEKTSVDRSVLRDVARLTLESGKLMLASGAETSRVEETARRIGRALGIDVECVVTPTGITVSAGGDRPVTRIARIHRRSIDLSKVAAVNALSRSLEAGEVGLQTAVRRLRELAEEPALYPPRVKYLAQGLGTAGFAVLVGGGARELLPAFLAGLLVRTLDARLQPLPPFLSVFLSALAVTGWAALSTLLFPGVSGEKLILAGVIPLLPGLALTNAIRDLMGGELLAGVARGAEALLTAGGLAGGVYIGLELGRGWL